MDIVDKIAYSLLALFLRLHDLEPLLEEAWERRTYGPHIVWTVSAIVPAPWDTTGFYDQLSCSLWEYIEHHNDLKLNIKFQPYDVVAYNTNSTATVYVSIYQ